VPKHPPTLMTWTYSYFCYFPRNTFCCSFRGSQKRATPSARLSFLFRHLFIKGQCSVVFPPLAPPPISTPSSPRLYLKSFPPSDGPSCESKCLMFDCPISCSWTHLGSPSEHPLLKLPFFTSGREPLSPDRGPHHSLLPWKRDCFLFFYCLLPIFLRSSSLFSYSPQISFSRCSLLIVA